MYFDVSWAPRLKLVELDDDRLKTTNYPKIDIVRQICSSKILRLVVFYVGGFCNEIRASCKFASHLNIFCQPGVHYIALSILVG